MQIDKLKFYKSNLPKQNLKKKPNSQLYRIGIITKEMKQSEVNQSQKADRQISMKSIITGEKGTNFLIRK